MTRSKLTIAALAAATALTAAGSAQAQSAYYDRGYSYDPCRREETNRSTTGALVGGALGAVIGSNAAARGVRTEGALLGGALGAAVGAGVGKSSAACRDGSYAPRSTYYNSPYYNDGRYSSGYYNDRSYDNRYRDSRYYDDYAYDRSGDRYRVTERVGADGCSLAESPIYLPDGSVQKRFVRVCQDGSGRYQVVD